MEAASNTPSSYCRLANRIRALGAFMLVPLVAVHCLQAGTEQTITFAPIPAKQTTDAPFSISASASSGLPVALSIVSQPAVASLDGSTLSLTGEPGSVTVRASQSGNDTFDPAEPVYRSFTVQQGQFSVLAPGPTAAHRLAIRSNGTLWAWGRNSLGQIGNGDTADVFRPIQITMTTGWTVAAVGNGSSVAIRNGTLWTWGYNFYGQLGLGDNSNRTTPVQVGNLTSWTHVAAGSDFMIARRSDGTLWAWGRNQSGQLGVGDTLSRNQPTQIGTETSWMDVAAGGSHVIAIQKDGGSQTLWTWGANAIGQLGDGTTTPRNVPQQIGSVTTWSKLSCGETSSYAIRSDGTLWAWGANASGQLGVGNTSARGTPTQVGALTNWTEISGGNIHAIGRQADGSIWSMGGSGNIGATATPIGGSSPIRIGLESAWVKVAAGVSYCMALKSDGTIWSAGAHRNGQLGYPMNHFRPIATGGIKALAQSLDCTMFIKDDGTLWAVGRPGTGMFGIGSTAAQPLPVQVGTATNWHSLSLGNSHTLALRSDGTLWAAGAGSSGQIGDGAGVGRTTLVQVDGSLWKCVAAGGSHSLGVKTDGTLWAWGNNSSVEIGDATNTNRLSPVQVGSDTDWKMVACGASSSFGIKDNGTLWSWGGNSSGQLGNGTTASQNSPSQVGAANNWATITSGLAFTHAIREDGTLWAWGANSSGNLGDGTNTQRLSPVQIGTGTNWIAAYSASQHAVALQTDGSAWVTGLNSSSQLGTGDSANRNSFVPLSTHTMWSRVGSGRGLFTIAASADGTLWGTGNNSAFQLSSAQRVWYFLEPIHPAIGTQSIVFPPVQVTSFNTPISLSASSGSGLPISYFASGPASVIGDLLTVTGPGEVKLIAYQGGDRPAWHDTAIVQSTVNIVPFVALDETTDITATTATLNAQVSASGQPTTCLFEYDTDITDGTYTHSVQGSPALLSGFDTSNVTGQLSGLIPESTYHFRLTASNAAGDTSVLGTFSTPPLTAFEIWANGYGLALGPTLANSDPDGDGVSTLLEWLLGTHPLLTSSPIYSLIVNGGIIEFRYSRSSSAEAAGAIIAVEWNDPLDSTAWSELGVTQSVQSDNGTLQQVLVLLPAGPNGQRFVRLKVTAQ